MTILIRKYKVMQQFSAQLSSVKHILNIKRYVWCLMKVLGPIFENEFLLPKYIYISAFSFSKRLEPHHTCKHCFEGYIYGIVIIFNRIIMTKVVNCNFLNIKLQHRSAHLCIGPISSFRRGRPHVNFPLKQLKYSYSCYF